MSSPTTVEVQPTLKRPRLRSFRPDVEGLRALAIITVIGWHFQLPPFTGGFVGVDVFFVISGFVITQLLLRERSRTFGTSLLDFYARRIRRIVPAATLTLVGTMLAFWVVLGGTSAVSVAIDARDAALFFANVHFSHTESNYLLQQGPTSPLLHFWSLSIEEQFYFVWPSLFALLTALVAGVDHRKKLASVLVVITVASLYLSSWMTIHNPNAAYYSSFTRAGELALGALVAVALPWFRSTNPVVAALLTWLGLGAIFLSAIWYTNHTSFPGVAVLLPLLGTAAVIAFGEPRRRVGAELLLSWKPVVLIGGLSYSLYLWHYPVFVLAEDRLGHLPAWPWRLALIGVALCLAIVSHYLFENPIRRGAFFTGHRGATYALGAGLLATSVGLSFVIPAVANSATAPVGRAATIPGQAALTTALKQGAALHATPSLVVPLNQLANDFPDDDQICLVADDAATATGARPAHCYSGDLSATRTVVLYGDSHAAMWQPALDALGLKDHFRVDLVARASCEVADVAMWDYGSSGPGTECFAFHNWALNYIANEHPWAVVVADNTTAGVRYDNYSIIPPASYTTAMTSTFRALRAITSRVAYIGPEPKPLEDPTTCLEVNSSDVANCNTPLSEAKSIEYFSALKRAAHEADVGFINVNPWFCDSTTCPMIVNHTIVYFDQNHASQHYILELTALLGERLDQYGIN